MTPARRKSTSTLDVNLSVEDTDLDELEQLVGQQVVHAVVWEDSVIDAFDAAGLTDPVSDVDVYLEDNVRFELFAVLCYPALDVEPLDDVADVRQRMAALVASRSSLMEVAADTEDDLVLVLSDGARTLFLNAGAWSVDEWEELPA